MTIEKMTVALRGDLVRDITKHIAQQGNVWGVDEDLSDLMGRLESAVEESGAGEVLSAVAEDMATIRESVPSMRVMEAEYAIMHCMIRVPRTMGNGMRNYPYAPNLKVTGPVENVQWTVEKVAAEKSGDHDDVIHVRYLIGIDHDAYEIMVDEGMINDEESPFGVEVVSGQWKNDCEIEVTTKLR